MSKRRMAVIGFVLVFVGLVAGVVHRATGSSGAETIGFLGVMVGAVMCIAAGWNRTLQRHSR